MVNKKSQFIDKRRAATYHLVASARGPDDDEAGGGGDDSQRTFTRVAVRAAPAQAWRASVALTRARCVASRAAQGEGRGVEALDEGDEEAARAQAESRGDDAYADYPAWMRPQPPLSAARRAALLEVRSRECAAAAALRLTCARAPAAPRRAAGLPGRRLRLPAALPRPERQRRRRRALCRRRQQARGGRRRQDLRRARRQTRARSAGGACPAPRLRAVPPLRCARAALRARADGTAIPAQVDSVVAAALSRNTELAEIEAALAAAEAERHPGGDDEDGEAHGAESAGEGDLEDDFITAVLDAETGPSESEEEDEEYDEEEDEAAQAAMAAAAARARAARAPRPLDAAFEALASAEYSDTDIGCALGERSAPCAVTDSSFCVQGFGPRRGGCARHVRRGIVRPGAVRLPRLVRRRRSVRDGRGHGRRAAPRSRHGPGRARG